MGLGMTPVPVAAAVDPDSVTCSTRQHRAGPYHHPQAALVAVAAVDFHVDTPRPKIPPLMPIPADLPPFLRPPCRSSALKEFSIPEALSVEVALRKTTH